MLSLIAYAAKRHWGYPERWMERWREGLTITPEFVEGNEVYAALVEGEPVGFYALVGEGCRIELEHLWVLPERMGTGVGRALLEHAAGRAADLGAETLGIEADPMTQRLHRARRNRRERCPQHEREALAPFEQRILEFVESVNSS